MEQTEVLQTPQTFAFRGRDYKVAPRDFETEAAFCMWCRRTAIDEIERDRPHLPPHAYKLMWDGYRHDVASGMFAWGMPLVSASAISPEGAKQLAYLELAKFNDGVDLPLVDAMYNDAAAWDQLCRLRGDVNDPNRPRTQPVAAGAAS